MLRSMEHDSGGSAMSLSISFSRLACTIACCALLIACDSGGSGGGSTNRGTNPPPPPPPPPDSGTWGTVSLLENQDYGNVDQADIAIDANGNALVAWWELGAAGKANIMAAYYTAGTGWGAATLLEYDDRGDATTPKVAFDADGKI